MKVVFHLDDVNRWQRAKANIQNLLKETKDMTIVLLANGDAVKGYVAEENQAFIEETSIELHACRNALRGQKMAEDQLPTPVTVVPVGVLDLVVLQTAGYSYIKV